MEEERRTQETEVTEAAIISQAYDLFEKYTLNGQPIPQYELQTLRQEIADLPVQEIARGDKITQVSGYQQIRKDIGGLALKGSTVVNGTEVGPELLKICLKSGDEDGRLLETMLTANKLRKFKGEYNVTGIFKYYLRLRSFLKSGDHGSNIQEDLTRLRRAARIIREFLVEKGYSRIQEDILLTEELEVQEAMQEYFSKSLMKQDPNELTTELNSYKDESIHLWNMLGQVPFEESGALVARMLQLKSLIDSTKEVLASIKKDNHKPSQQPYIDPEIVKTNAFRRLAKIFLDDSEDPALRPDQAQRLREQSEQFTIKAEPEIIRGNSSEGEAS